MKLSRILEEARKGALIMSVEVNDASQIIGNATGKLSFNSTLFQQKYVHKFTGDEVVESLNGKKKTNITYLADTIRNHAKYEMTIRIGEINYSGLIEIDNENT